MGREVVINFNELPRFVIAGTPSNEFSGLRIPVWLTRDGDSDYRPTTRWDFAAWSLAREDMVKLLRFARKFDTYNWTIRVRPGHRRIFED